MIGMQGIAGIAEIWFCRLMISIGLEGLEAACKRSNESAAADSVRFRAIKRDFGDLCTILGATQRLIALICTLLSRRV